MVSFVFLLSDDEPRHPTPVVACEQALLGVGEGGGRKELNPSLVFLIFVAHGRKSRNFLSKDSRLSKCIR